MVEELRAVSLHVARYFDEVALQEWRGEKIFRERFFYDPTKING